MQVTSNYSSTTLDNFTSQPNNSNDSLNSLNSLNSLDNQQPSTSLNSTATSNTNANTNTATTQDQTQSPSTQSSSKYQQYNSSLESNYFKSLLNTALPNNKPQTSSQPTTNIKPGDTLANQPTNQSLSTSTKTESNTETSKITTTNVSPKSNYDINKIPGVKDNANVNTEFLAKVDTIAKELETDSATLLAIMSFETGATFSPTKINPSTGATGLIQFIPSTARSLLTKTLKDPKIDFTDKKKLIDKLPVDGQTKEQLLKLSKDVSQLPIREKQLRTDIDRLTLVTKNLTTQLNQAKLKKLPQEQQDQIKSQLNQVSTQKTQLKAEQKSLSAQIKQIPESIDIKISKEVAIATFKQMSSVEQLDYVKQFLLPYKGKLNNPQDAYLAVLFPKAVGQGSNPNAPVFSSGTEYYDKNQGLDGIINGKKDGVVTVGEATKKVTDFLKNARQ